jgi:hypothetical protein
LKGNGSVTNRIERISGLRARLALLTITLLLGSVSAFAQATPTPATDTLSGRYEGVVKSATAGGADEKVALELKSEGGKISARAMHGDVTVDVTEATLAGGTLTLRFGQHGVVTAKVDGDKLTGDWVAGTQKRAVELKKVTPAPAAAAAPASAAAKFDLNGQWEAVADANGQPFPFLLILKVDGESVTGSSSSQLGDSVVKDGNWKDGKLVFTLEGQNGNVALSATVIEGKLSGEFDFSGQLQGKWVAVKKN